MLRPIWAPELAGTAGRGALDLSPPLPPPACAAVAVAAGTRPPICALVFSRSVAALPTPPAPMPPTPASPAPAALLAWPQAASEGGWWPSAEDEWPCDDNDEADFFLDLERVRERKRPLVSEAMASGRLW